MIAEFIAGKKEENMKKSRIIPIILTLIIWAGMYYYYLPPLNIHSNAAWMFFVAAVLVGLVLN